MGDDGVGAHRRPPTRSRRCSARPRRARRRRVRVHVVAARAARRARRPRRAVEPRGTPTSWSRWRRPSDGTDAARSSSSRASFLDGLRRRRPRAHPRDGDAASGRPVHLNTLTLMPHAPDGWSRSLEFARRSRGRGPRRPPDVRDQPAGRPLRARRHVPVRRDAELPRHADAPGPRRAGGAPRSRACATRCARSSPIRPAGRSCSSGRCCGSSRSPGPSTSAGSTAASPRSPRPRALDPLDAFLDLSLAEDLATQFVLAAPPDAEAPRRRPRR